jgi:hypothetical protein
MFKDSSDTSIKRVIAFLGFLFLAITMFINSFSKEEFKPDPNLINAVLTITVFCIGGNVVEKFKDFLKPSGENNQTP